MVPAAQTLNRGDSVTLQCTSMGGPGNTFRWFLNNFLLLGETSPTLIRQNVTVADGGMYNCIVSNTAGNNGASTSIFIFPYFTSQPQGVGGSNRGMAAISCVAEAFPTPTYQWSRVDGATIGSTVMGQTTSTLVFSSIQFRDEGEYVCNATSNGVTIQSQSATLSGETCCFLSQRELR